MIESASLERGQKKCSFFLTLSIAEKKVFSPAFYCLALDLSSLAFFDMMKVLSKASFFCGTTELS